MGQSSGSISVKADDGINKIPVSHNPVIPAAADGSVVRFQWGRSAHSVYVAGSFNSWKERIPMTFNGTVWSVDLRLPPGNHFYKFVVEVKEGVYQWSVDQSKPTRSDPIGNMNNIIEVSERIPVPDDDGEYTNDITPIGKCLLATNKSPETQPRQLRDTPLNEQMKDSGVLRADITRGPTNTDAPAPVAYTDVTLLPLPQHVVLTHVFHVHSTHYHQYGMSVRYRNKFVSTILITASDLVVTEREKINDEGVIDGDLPPGETLSWHYTQLLIGVTAEDLL